MIQGGDFTVSDENDLYSLILFSNNTNSNTNQSISLSRMGMELVENLVMEKNLLMKILF